MKLRLPTFTALLAAALLFLAGCGRSGPQLNLLAWSEYVPQPVIDGFTRETGIRVNYEAFASNEELLAKLLTGAARYDVVQPSDYAVEALIKAGKLQPLDLAKLPNTTHLAPDFLNLPHDPGNRFSVPWMGGTVGIVINTALIHTPIAGYRDVFQEAHRGKIIAVKDSRELVSWALATLGRSCNDTSADGLTLVRPVLQQWIPLVKVWDSDSPKTALLNGDVALGVVWSGEAAQLWQEDKKFRYVLPAEGAHRFIDNLAIPAGAAQADAAHQFINYCLRPEVSKLISDAFPYTNPNLAARRLLSAEQLANPASYPTNTAGLETFRDLGRHAAAIDQLVTELKNAQ
jgi:spermidine/putrescine transport system substrate-binding protein